MKPFFQNLFVAESGCSLLMQCSDFELEPVKYCGADTALRQSVNHGGRLLVRFRTNGKRNAFPGFRLKLSTKSQRTQYTFLHILI